MPELGPRDLSSVKKLQQEVNSFTGTDDFAGGNHNTLLSSELNNLTKKHGQKYIDHGAEVVVVRNKDRPDTLLALNFKNVESKEAKQTFYLHRLFSILFPHNFPHFYASTGVDAESPQSGIIGTVRQEIKRARKAKRDKILYSIFDVQETCNKLCIGFYVDEDESNLIIGTDGGEYFVDTLHPDEIFNLDEGRILKYMEEKKYKPEDIAAAKTSLERLKALGHDVE